MISRRGAKAQRNDTLSVCAPLREEETFLDNYNNYFWILSLRGNDGIVVILPCIPTLVDLCGKINSLGILWEYFRNILGIPSF